MFNSDIKEGLERGAEKMIKEERQKYLMDLLSQYKFLKVRDIVNELKITDMTVRRDFQELEDKGLIIRVHGGKNY